MGYILSYKKWAKLGLTRKEWHPKVNPTGWLRSPKVQVRDKTAASPLPISR
jgi:hypothetical protein